MFKWIKDKEKLNEARIIAEILALAVAGGWGLFLFFQTVFPSLEHRADIESSFVWMEPPSPEHCTARVGITLKNIGKTAFNIKSITLKVWRVPKPSPPKGIELFDPLKIQKSDPLFVIHPGEESLLGRYPIDVEMHDDYVFTFPRDASRLSIFRFEAEWQSMVRSGTFTNYVWTTECEKSGPGLDQTKPNGPDASP